MLRDFSRCTPVFYAILVAAHLYFTRCASERERSERERCASSRVPLAAEAGRGPAGGRPEGGLLENQQNFTKITLY